MSTLPNSVSIVEVGPRDGLQNEPLAIALQDKVDLIHGLADAGLQRIEAGSFVSPKWVPQMADSSAVFASLTQQLDTRYSALTPNMKGLEAALEAGVQEVAVFAAVSESFSQKNINCSISESIERFKPVVNHALENRINVRAYISCVVGCPYEGAIAPQAVADISELLIELGCYEVSLGDTIGIGTAGSIATLLDVVANRIEVDKLAIHCHDTYGQALSNIYASLQYGIQTIDSSVAGLGGCPYAPGASGNVATEDLVYMLNGLDIECGVDLDKLVTVGQLISLSLNRTNQSKVAQAIIAKTNNSSN